MRQVPLLIGNGRLATHMRHYFALLGIECTQWHRHMDSPLEALASKADVIFLLISDKAITPFYEAHRTVLASKQCIHCSGALYHEAIMAAHPLMTFSDTLYDLETYRNIPLVLDRHSALPLDIPNPIGHIDPILKPLYHAQCVMANNFTTLLWQQFQRRLEEMGLPPSFAQPILHQTAHNITHEKHPLTGPLVRGDQPTIDAHLACLAEDEADLYKAFVTLYKHQQEDA